MTTSAKNVTCPNETERIPCRVFHHAIDASGWVAEEIVALIRARAKEGRPCILGLATGSTPTGVYDALIRMHREEGLSFQNVVTFNLDEYYPMQPKELQSYVRFMKENLFDHIDIKPENIHVPDGTQSEHDVAEYCQRYEARIQKSGGIDLQLLGIGRTGHIGFNEPGSGKKSRTRMITLDRVTRRDAASVFLGEENVPRRAITMGVGTILEARRVILIAWGEGKAEIVKQAIEGEVSTDVAASFLQEHPNAQIVLDQAAAERLTRCRETWVMGPVEWDDEMTRKAVLWLVQELEKPLLKLTAEDYNEEGLQDLLATRGSAYDLNLKVFRSLQATITGWPGGKPEERKEPGDRHRPGDDIFPKRVLIFSSHPDDDVISMGDTLLRLVEQGHEVHVAYQTSGNIAIFDDDAAKFVEFAGEFNRNFDINPDRTSELESHLQEYVHNKQPGQVDCQEVQLVKGLIRRAEARAATKCCGVPKEQLHFMDMPFYETGRVRKKPLGEEDVQLTVDLLREIEPHQIYVAGDLSDPHATHRTCLLSVLTACERVRSDGWYNACQVWLYRGAWQEWSPHQIDMAVPISPEEMLRKRVAIFNHESQKDKALFPGPDTREFWQRAEDRNRRTAQLYGQLGLAEYEAIEGFMLWNGEPV